MPINKKYCSTEQLALAMELFLMQLSTGMDVDSEEQQEAAIEDSMYLAEEFFNKANERYTFTNEKEWIKKKREK